MECSDGVPYLEPDQLVGSLELPMTDSYVTRPQYCQANIWTKYGPRKCGAVLEPPNRTDCPICGASDEDET